MKFNNSLLGILVALPLLAATAGCSGGGGGDGGGGGGAGGGAAAALMSIAVTPADSTIDVGEIRNFTAIGTYSDNTTQNLTASATWTSLPDSVAVVSSGAATARNVGTAKITATFGGISQFAMLRVTDSTGTANVMSISVDGALCSAATSSNYINKACVSVTICNPGTSTCQTVNDVLLDTGSYGLRIFKQAIPGLTLPNIPSGSGSLAGCIQFADGTSLWGPIQLAGVQLGNEPAVQVPIHVVDASFGTRPAHCASADATPVSAGLTGILGVGVFSEDCGPGCVGHSGNGIYYSCTGSSCSGAAVALANQVQNPVAHLPQDNNGVMVQLPAVPLGGVFSVTGSLFLGIGTQANNTATSLPTVFPTDLNGNHVTVFDNFHNVSFLDTGSNGLFFPSTNPLLPVCPAPNSEWYCPPLTRALLATTVGAFGAPSATTPFNVGNFIGLMNTPYNVFSEIAGPSTFGFDWGLPFFMGRKVYFGIEGKAGLGATGPYVAY